MKRKIDDNNDDNNDDSYHKNDHPNKKKCVNFVSASKIRNFILNDPIIDWFKIKYKSKNKSFSNNFLFQKGYEFEKYVINLLKQKINVTYVSNYITDETCKQTIEYMKHGVPLLYSAPVKNNINNTHGIIDLLVRSDYLSYIFENSPISIEDTFIKSPKINKNFYYVVIDIKFSTLHLVQNGKFVSNSNTFKPYKSQLLFYTQIIGLIQGYTSKYAFLLGKKCKYKENNKIIETDNCLSKLGIVNFETFDNQYLEKNIKAIQWIDYVQNNKLSPFCSQEMYPNMTINSNDFGTKKKKLAEKKGEITLLWNCGIKNRNFAHKNNIYSWKNKRCNSKTLGIKSVKHSNIIDNILKVNRNNNIKIIPSVIKNNLCNWKRSKKYDFYVDFEVLSYNLFNIPFCHKTSTFIFMIGVGWEENNTWKYKNFTCNSISFEEEQKLINNFISFIGIYKNPKLYYWFAEENFWKKIVKRYHIKNTFTWIDLYKIFKNEPIVIKGSLNFKLKSIADSMYKQNMITTKITSTCSSGFEAMINAYNLYQNKINPSTSKEMQDIIKYNEFDCKVLWDILKYLRINNT